MAKLFLTASILLGLSSAICTDETRAKRHAWHTFSVEEKSAYINAELCLMSKPPSLGLPVATNRHEEFQAIHQLQTYSTHYVAAFLPFHRAIMFAHEEALREECGYKGRQPYWYEQIDAEEFGSSGIFDPDTGFGGNGTGPGSCIEDGPFAGYVNHIGPLYTNKEHCIWRIQEVAAMEFGKQSNIDACLAKETWRDAWRCMEDLPHKSGHGGVGGLMRDAVASPGDPLFYLHHTFLDKVWADWQDLGLPGRLTEMYGPNIQSENPDTPATFPTRPSTIPAPTGADGDPGTETTLNHVLNLYGNGRNYTIADVMDIRNGILCYEYVEPEK